MRPRLTNCIGRASLSGFSRPSEQRASFASWEVTTRTGYSSVSSYTLHRTIWPDILGSGTSSQRRYRRSTAQGLGDTSCYSSSSGYFSSRLGFSRLRQLTILHQSLRVTLVEIIEHLTLQNLMRRSDRPFFVPRGQAPFFFLCHACYDPIHRRERPPHPLSPNARGHGGHLLLGGLEFRIHDQLHDLSYVRALAPCLQRSLFYRGGNTLTIHARHDPLS